MKKLLFVISILLLLSAGCGNIKSAGKSPTISSLMPNSGMNGTTITLIGTGFTSASNNVLWDGYTYDSANSTDGKTLQTTVPYAINCAAGSCARFREGAYKISVTNVNGKSNYEVFTVALPK